MYNVLLSMKYMYIFWFRPCCHQADRPVGNVTRAHGCWCQWCQWWPCCAPAAPPPPSSSSPTSSELYPGLREVHCSSLVIAIEGNDNQISWWKRTRKNHDNNDDDMVHLLTNLVCTSSGFCSGWSGCQGDHPLLCQRQPDQEYDGDGFVVRNITITIMSDL